MHHQPRFPAIFISTDNSFDVISNLSEICTCTSRGFRLGFYNGLSLYDSDGLLWQVTAATPSRRITVLDRLLNRRFEVSISLTGPRADSTQFAVELMTQLIDNHSGGLYDQFVSHEELKRRLRCARCPAELIEVARSLGTED